MYPCIEAIAWRDGKAERLIYHQKRVEEAFRVLFPDKQPFMLKELLQSVDGPGTGLYKLRLEYGVEPGIMEFQEYRMRNVSSLQLVGIDHEPMEYKATERDYIDRAFSKRGLCDDVLMVRDGLLTDSSYANIALFDGKKWLSPRIPLLYGTRRAYLVDHGQIEPADIKADDLVQFQRIRLFNAMIGFGELELPVSAISGF